MPRTTHRTATEQIHAGLTRKGYRYMAQYPTPEDSYMLEWRLYTDVLRPRYPALVMQVWRDGGCELYTPLTDHTGIAETIAAIP